MIYLPKSEKKQIQEEWKMIQITVVGKEKAQGSYFSAYNERPVLRTPQERERTGKKKSIVSVQRTATRFFDRFRRYGTTCCNPRIASEIETQLQQRAMYSVVRRVESRNNPFLQLVVRNERKRLQILAKYN